MLGYETQVYEPFSPTTLPTSHKEKSKDPSSTVQKAEEKHLTLK